MERGGTAGTSPTKEGKAPATQPASQPLWTLLCLLRALPGPIPDLWTQLPSSTPVPALPWVPQACSPAAHLSVQVRVQEHDGTGQGVYGICLGGVSGEKVLEPNSAFPLPTLGG